MESRNIGRMVIGAIKELAGQNSPTTLKNICGVIAMHQRKKTEEIMGQIKEALNFAIYYGVVRKNGTQFIIEKETSTNNGAVQDGVGAELTSETTGATEAIAKVHKEDKPLNEGKVSHHADGNVENNSEDNAENAAGDSYVDTDLEVLDTTDLDVFSSDVAQQLVRYTKGRRANRPRGQQQNARHGRFHRNARGPSGRRSARIARGSRSARIARGSRSARTRRGRRSARIARGSRSARTRRGRSSARIGRGSRSARTRRGRRSARIARGSRSARIARGSRSRHGSRASHH